MKFLSNWKNILILCLSFLVIFFSFKSCNLLNQLNDNYIILSDSLTTYKNKANELYVEKQSYITDIKNLKEINDNLYKEVKKLKDNPIVVTEIKTETIIDSIEIETIKYVYIDDIIMNKYHYNDEFINIDLSTSTNIKNNKSTLYINSISMKSDIYTSLIEKDDRLYLISRASNPYLHITDVNGGLLNIDDSKTIKKYLNSNKSFIERFSLGITSGITVLYDFTTQNTVGGLGLTIGLTYKLN